MIRSRAVEKRIRWLALARIRPSRKLYQAWRENRPGSVFGQDSRAVALLMLVVASLIAFGTGMMVARVNNRQPIISTGLASICMAGAIIVALNFVRQVRHSEEVKAAAFLPIPDSLLLRVVVRQRLRRGVLYFIPLLVFFLSAITQNQFAPRFAVASCGLAVLQWSLAYCVAMLVPTWFPSTTQGRRGCLVIMLALLPIVVSWVVGDQWPQFERQVGDVLLLLTPPGWPLLMLTHGLLDRDPAAWWLLVPSGITLILAWVAWRRFVAQYRILATEMITPTDVVALFGRGVDGGSDPVSVFGSETGGGDPARIGQLLAEEADAWRVFLSSAQEIDGGVPALNTAPGSAPIEMTDQMVAVTGGPPRIVSGADQSPALAESPLSDHDGGHPPDRVSPGSPSSGFGAQSGVLNEDQRRAFRQACRERVLSRDYLPHPDVWPLDLQNGRFLERRIGNILTPRERRLVDVCWPAGVWWTGSLIWTVGVLGVLITGVLLISLLLPSLLILLVFVGILAAGASFSCISFGAGWKSADEEGGTPFAILPFHCGELQRLFTLLGAARALLLLPFNVLVAWGSIIIFTGATDFRSAMSYGTRASIALFVLHQWWFAMIPLGWKPSSSTARLMLDFGRVVAGLVLMGCGIVMIFTASDVVVSACTSGMLFVSWCAARIHRRLIIHGATDLK